jgi:hypothetical protein
VKYGIGDRVYYYAARMKGTIRERRRDKHGGVLYKLDWDSPLMSRTMWVEEWHLHPIPVLEQLAESAE